MKHVYLDNAATTAVDPEVFRSMKPYFFQKYGNASEFHALGQEARKAVELARSNVASFFKADPQEIIFTGCATESINLAHKGVIEALSEQLPGKKFHIITTSVEHSAVLATCKHLEKTGVVKVTYLPVDRFGQVKVEDVEKAIRPETVLVSVMFVNNEVGSIQPVLEIGRLLKQVNERRLVDREPKIYFHTDATQAVQHLDCDVNNLGVDLLSFTGHKLRAPKGIGALYVRKGTPIRRQLDGGSQEFGLRAGTENVPYIVGLGKAVELSSKFKVQSSKLVANLRELLINEILKIPGVELTGHPVKRAPHIASFVIDGVEGESLVLLLSNKKIIVSTGSACTSSNLQPSHVLTAMGYPPEKSHGSLRLSLGKDTTEEDIEYFIKALSDVINKLRRMAPKI